MKQTKQGNLDVMGTSISVLKRDGEDYISLTDMTRHFEGDGALIEQWLRTKDTLLFLAAWERMNNPDFNSLEFEGIKSEAGRNSFFMSTKRWIQLVKAKGIIASAGRYGGTLGHKDIAFEFGTWLSPEFKLYLIKDFQRLKEAESRRESLDWNLNRTLSKLNYRIHTDAIKEHIVPQLTPDQSKFAYANEADLLNVALFGQTAKQWRDSSKSNLGNIREEASIHQLLVLSNIESLNAEFIRMGLTQTERLQRLNHIARTQLTKLLESNAEARIRSVTSQALVAEGQDSETAND